MRKNKKYSIPTELIREFEKVRNDYNGKPAKYPIPLKRKLVSFIKNSKIPSVYIANKLGVHNSAVTKWKRDFYEELPPTLNFVPIREEKKKNSLEIHVFLGEEISIRFSSDISPSWVVNFIKEFKESCA